MECTLLEEIEVVPKSSDSAPTSSWMLHVDGLSNTRGVGDGLILASPDSIMVEQALFFSFKTLNNEAEYEALLTGQRLA